jgi:hypothetical protein
MEFESYLRSRNSQRNGEMPKFERAFTARDTLKQANVYQADIARLKDRI